MTLAQSSRDGGYGRLMLAIFLLSFSLLSFEIITVRSINFVLGPSHIYVAIALAMLGLSAAGSLLSFIDLRRITGSGEVLFGGLCVVLAVMLVGCHMLVALEKDVVNASVAAAGRAGGLDAVVRTWVREGLTSSLKVGVFLGAPYFIFGVILSLLFATQDAKRYAALYGADLIGAALGSVGAVVVMEVFDFAASVTFPAVVAALAGVCFAGPLNKKTAVFGAFATALLLMAPWNSWYARHIEPEADAQYLVRDYNFSHAVKEVWRGWNSFTRVGAVEWEDSAGQGSGLSLRRGAASLALANGDGQAFLLPYVETRDKPWLHKPAIPAMLAGTPSDVLVIFAGAGADLMSLREHGAKRVVGVELNSKLVEAGHALQKYRLKDFLADPSVELIVEEGRAFLERNTRKFDTILLSWSGATAVYYAGALGGTTQYMFTYEGLQRVFDHLKPGGHAVVLQVNKLRVLGALRRYFAERGLSNPADSVIILYRDGHVRKWNEPWDDNPLLFKPSGWSAQDVDRVIENANRHGLKVAYAPGKPINPEYEVYSRLLNAADAAAELDKIERETNQRFAVVTDNRPFYLDGFYPPNYVSATFWRNVFSGDVSPHDFLHVVRVILFLLLSLVAVVIIIGPLFLAAEKVTTSRKSTFMMYFCCLGAGFMLLEIALIQKASLLIGEPGLTIAIVLGGVILLSGIGSLISDWSFAKGLSIRLTAILVVIYVVALIILFDAVMQMMMTWPLFAKSFVLLLAIAPSFLLMGHMFPQGLKEATKEDPLLVPWAWGINGATGTIAAGMAPLAAQAFGFQAVMLMAGCLYAVSAMLTVSKS